MSYKRALDKIISESRYLGVPYESEELVTGYGEPAVHEDVSAVESLVGGVPGTIRLFWSEVGSARILYDPRYGQAGLILYGPGEASAATALYRQAKEGQSRNSDLVIGEFCGLSQYAIVSSEWGDSVFATLPMDPRSDWPRIAENLLDLIEKWSDNDAEIWWPC